MADKTQNININYRVNTAEVQKAEATLQRAQAANDKFAKSSQTSGQQFNNSWKSAGVSIETLRGKVEFLRESIIKASDPKVVRRLSDEYKKLKAELDKAIKAAFQLEKAQSQVTKATADQNKQLDATSNSIGNIYRGVKLFLAAGLLKETIQTTLEMAKLAGNIDGVQRAFRKIPDGEIILNDLRKATQGTVTDFELMKQALQAKNFGLPVEKLAKLLEFATAKAQQTGLSIDYITNSLVTGLGRKSERVFDNLQLDIAELRKRIASGLDFRTAGIQLITEDLERMGGVIETTATKVDQLAVSWSELGKEMAQIATQDGGVVDFYKNFVNSAELLAEAQRRGMTVQELATERLRMHNAQVRFSNLSQFGLTGTIEENTKVIEDNLKTLTHSVGAWAAMRDEYNKDIAVLKERNKNVLNIEAVKEIKLLERLRDAKREEALEDQEVIKLLQARLQAMKETNNGVEELTKGLIELKEAEIQAKLDDIKTAKSTGEIHRLNLALSQLQGELEDLKAFGTTKQFLTVEGRLRLVPVTEPKNIQKYKVDIENALGELEVKVKTIIEFDKPSSFKMFKDEFDDDWLYDLTQSIPTPNPITLPTPKYEPGMWEKVGDEFSENWQGILGQGLTDTADFFNSVVQAEADQYDARIKQSQDYYDRLMILAGDNEGAKDRLRLKAAQQENKLRREAFEADKKAKRSQAIINGATGIINAFATLPYPAAIVASAFIAAATIKQLSVIDQQKARFAKGGLNIQGPGNGTSDSINAKISKGESVMTAEETRKSFGILKAVRAKRLDDRILENLKLSNGGVQVVNGMSDKRLLKKLDELKNSMPDYVQQGGVLWKTKVKSDTYRRWVRAKTI